MVMVDVVGLLGVAFAGGGADDRPRVLDVGCGPCEEGESLLEAGVRLTCIDQDGETISRVRQRISEAELVAADAAQWLAAGHGPYDVVLMRRPDLFHRARSWRQVFRLLPKALAPDGRVVVTTPGRGEARLAERWLAELAGTVNVAETDEEEEGFAIVAEDMRKAEAPDDTAGDPRDDERASLVRSLAWEGDEPAMVCDVRTGRCTVVSDEGK
jgi:trans-aconitate methyltransferase